MKKYSLFLTALIFLFIVPLSASGEVFYIDTDNVGSPVAMWDAQGKKVWDGEYLPFGEEFRTTESPLFNKNRFVGKEKDKENTSKKGLRNPFKNKTAEQVDEIFTKKGFTKSGPDPVGGTGGYVNPKTGRSCHIDPKNWGKHREPNHVDVNRPRDYKGLLEKKKLPYKED